MESSLREKITSVLLREKKKEYVCHIQYVVEIGLRLTEKYKADRDVIEAACLLHDIGRDKELPGESHSQAGKRMVKEILNGTNFSDEQKEKDFQKFLDKAILEVKELGK